jgi:uncharacterized protein (DUF1778 family)
MRGAERKQARLEARVTRAQKRLIERAASLRGTSVTDFVVASAQEAATSTIKESQFLHLRERASRHFVGVILNPPKPNEVARAAVARYRKNVVARD